MTISKLKVLSALLACVLTLGGIRTFANYFRGPARTSKTAPAEPKAEKVQAAQIRSDAARLAYETTMKDFGAGRLTDIEVIYRWSRRWMDNQLAASETREERIASR